jgi:hypothetical protein
MNKNYKIGYGKPPKEHQFRPGQSGNRNGRPAKKHALENEFGPLEIIMRVLAQQITISDRSGPRRVPAIEAIAWRFARNVAVGKSRAKIVLDLIDHFYSWENQHARSGQMEIVFVDSDGSLLPEPLPEHPAHDK